VYVGLDSRVEATHGLPDWLLPENGWELTDLTAGTHDGAQDIIFELYSRRFAANELVRLGSNGPGYRVMMYTVFVKAYERETVPTIYIGDIADNWIDLHNPTDVRQSTKGMYLYDGWHDEIWQLPAVILNPGESVRIRVAWSTNLTAIEQTRGTIHKRMYWENGLGTENENRIELNKLY
jgi:hypothetical protein